MAAWPKDSLKFWDFSGMNRCRVAETVLWHEVKSKTAKCLVLDRESFDILLGPLSDIIQAWAWGDGWGVERYTWMQFHPAQKISQTTVPELFQALKIQFNWSTKLQPSSFWSITVDYLYRFLGLSTKQGELQGCNFKHVEQLIILFPAFLKSPCAGVQSHWSVSGTKRWEQEGYARSWRWRHLSWQVRVPMCLEKCLLRKRISDLKPGSLWIPWTLECGQPSQWLRIKRHDLQRVGWGRLRGNIFGTGVEAGDSIVSRRHATCSMFIFAASLVSLFRKRVLISTGWCLFI